MIRQALFLVLVCQYASGNPRALWGTQLPTEGGRTVLSGFEFQTTIDDRGNVFATDSASIEVVVGGIPCLSPRVHSDTLLSCSLPGNTGGCNLDIVVVSEAARVNSSRDTSAPGYSYQAPRIEECPPIMEIVPDTYQTIVLKGRNFGLTNVNQTVQVNFIKRPGAEPINCLAIEVTKPHEEIRCELDFKYEGMSGEYFIQISVNGCENDWINEPTLTLGQCYSLQSLTTDQINEVLLRKAYEKNLKRLGALEYEINRLKSNLPEFTENNCCGGDYEYIVSLLELSKLDQKSLQFKDELLEFCSARDHFQEHLLALHL